MVADHLCYFKRVRYKKY